MEILIQFFFKILQIFERLLKNFIEIFVKLSLVSPPPSRSKVVFLLELGTHRLFACAASDNITVCKVL